MPESPTEQQPTHAAAADLWQLRFLAEPTLSPDGTRVACAIAQANREKNEYVGALWAGPADGSAPLRRFTRGEARDSLPVWSPDGRWIAFVSNRSGQKEIWLIPADGGEARQVTYTPHGAKDPRWAPDSCALAFTAERGPDDPTPQAGAFETAEERKKRREAADKAKREEPLRHARLRYKHDTTGLWEGRWIHIWVQALDAAGESVGDPRQVTDGPYDDSPAAWSPDGRWIAFSSNRTPEGDVNLVSDVFVVPAGGGEPQQLTRSTGPAHDPAWSPDGAALAYIGHDRRGEMGGGTNSHVYVIPFLPGEATADERRDLSAGLDRSVGGGALGDSRLGGGAATPVWSLAGDAVYAIVSNEGRVEVWRFPVAPNGEPERLLGGDRAIGEFVLAADGRRLAFVAGDTQNPGDLYSADLDAAGRVAEERRLTAVNADLLEARHVPAAEEIWFEADDGTPLQGWVLKPPDFTPERRYPALLHIHGGPHSMYGFTFFLEFQMLAAQGFVVFYMNPRGSQGYGQAFVEAIRRAWGGVDYDDLMTGVDTLIAQGYVDPERLGVLGGSYGGFMTCWIVGHTDRFRAAVASRSVTNLISMYGSSDAGWMLEDWEFAPLFAEPDAFQLLWERSPLAYAANVTTPLLLTHGVNDLRCAIGQAEEMYVALKRHGKTAELVRFPGGSHELARGGAPRMRIGRLDAIRDWLVQYLAP